MLWVRGGGDSQETTSVVNLGGMEAAGEEESVIPRISKVSNKPATMYEAQYVFCTYLVNVPLHNRFNSSPEWTIRIKECKIFPSRRMHFWPGQPLLSSYCMLN